MHQNDDHMNHLGWLNCTECHQSLVNLSQPLANIDISRYRDNGHYRSSICRLFRVSMYLRNKSTFIEKTIVVIIN